MGNVSTGDSGGLKKEEAESNYVICLNNSTKFNDFFLWNTQHSIANALSVLGPLLIMLPVFESKCLFEGGANVTE